MLRAVLKSAGYVLLIMFHNGTGTLGVSNGELPCYLLHLFFRRCCFADVSLCRLSELPTAALLFGEVISFETFH